MPLPSPARLLLAAGALLLTSAAPATARPLSVMPDPAPITLEVVDPPGDRLDPANTSAQLDLLSAKVTQDRALGILKAEVTFQEPPAGARAWLHVGLGLATKSGECAITPTVGGTAHLVTNLEERSGTFAFGGPMHTPVAATRNDIGTLLTLESPQAPNLVSLQRWSCARFDVDATNPYTTAPPVASASALSDPPPGLVQYDTAVVFAVNGPPSSGPILTLGPDGKVTVPDGDADGVSDATDRCPAVAGARTDGCATVVGKASLRLAGRTLKIDRLLPAKGERCPIAVRVTVRAGARRLGSRQLGVVQHGRLCHVEGSVALKAKATKVKVAVSGKGLKTLKRTVRR